MQNIFPCIWKYLKPTGVVRNVVVKFLDIIDMNSMKKVSPLHN